LGLGGAFQVCLALYEKTEQDKRPPSWRPRIKKESSRMKCTLFSILAFTLVSCGIFQNTETFLRGNNWEGVIIKVTSDSRNVKRYFGIVPSWNPTADQIKRLEHAISNGIATAKFDSESYSNQTMGVSSINVNRSNEILNIQKTLPHYYRQYIGIDVNGEKRIFVNFFKKEHENKFAYWKNQIVVVLDGGSDFWSIQYCVKGNRFVELQVNGNG
jgi:hypothetical protein